MATYKLNILHIHLTDDEAWRLQIKKYPQFTTPQFMIRNKGYAYSTKEIKELIAYCHNRHITFVPEIDMPGHRQAFTKAMV
jgi:hexosaminidase